MNDAMTGGLSAHGCLTRFVNLERVKVTRNDGVGKEGARLVFQVFLTVATGDVREDQLAHIGVARQPRRLPGGDMGILPRHIGFLVAVSGFGDQRIGLARHLQDVASLARIPGHHQLRVSRAQRAGRALQSARGLRHQRRDMTNLGSYQLEGSFNATMFYADIEGHPDDRPVKLA